ncbi:MAG TPA: metal-dependent hydrolase [Pyrinomonadaceae bacterium]|nr:metal-dependent hydrolase [Pyrinomonadaceae bacterium]
MDNLTHSLVGLAVAKAGLERLSPGATAACVLAANAPDIDILAVLGGRWFYLHNHRGITHSFLGTLALAFFIPCLFYGVDLLAARIGKRPSSVRFKGLLIASLIASATHPLMDWTNNYGVRPFLPWSGSWYYGDLVFIVDPWIWLLVGGAAFLLTSKRIWQTVLWTLLALVLTVLVFSARVESAGMLYPNVLRVAWVTAVIGLVLLRLTRVLQPWGSKLALAALAAMLIYWGGLAVTHRMALSKVQAIAEALSVERGETVARMAAMPVLADPFRWLCVVDTDRATYRFFLSLTDSGSEPTTDLPRFEKLRGDDASVAARASADERALIFLDFARFPISRVEGDCLNQLLVLFDDLRYTDPRASQRGTFSLEVPVSCDDSVENKK